MNAGFKIPARIDAEPAERRFDLRVYLNFVWRHWMFIGAVVALAFARGADLPCARNSALHRDNPSAARAAREGSRSGCCFQRCPLRLFRTSKTSLQSSDPTRCCGGLSSRSGSQPPLTTRIAERRRRQRGSDIGGSPSHLAWHKSPAGSVGSFAQRAGPCAQHFHYLGRSGPSRAARQRGGGCLCCRPARRPI